MSEITKPLLLDGTGQQMVKELHDIAMAVRGFEYETSTWSVTINNSQSSPILPVMGGDHTSWLIYREKIGRYQVTNDGKARKLDKNNSRLFADRTEVNEDDGHIMVRFPRLYYKVTEEGSLTTITMCEREFAEECNEIDEQWIGAYIGAVVNNAFVSRAGLNPTRSHTISQFWTAAQQNGTNWGLVDYTQYQIMLLCYICEYLDLNSQAALGNGMTGTGGNWSAVVQNAKTGDTRELGDNCGKVMFTEDGQLVGGASHVSLFGIEDPYGWFWTMVQGCYFGNSENEEQDGTECFIYEGNHMPSADELATHPAGQYRQIVRPISTGWVRSLILGANLDIIPKTLGGSSTTYWCDYHYTNNTGQLLLWGGFANAGSACGFVYSDSDNAFSDSYSHFGSRLAYHGKDIEIIGTENNSNVTA